MKYANQEKFERFVQAMREQGFKIFVEDRSALRIPGDDKEVVRFQYHLKDGRIYDFSLNPAKEEWEMFAKFDVKMFPKFCEMTKKQYEHQVLDVYPAQLLAHILKAFWGNDVTEHDDAKECLYSEHINYITQGRSSYIIKQIENNPTEFKRKIKMLDMDVDRN